jgi:hypothetical protein
MFKHLFIPHDGNDYKPHFFRELAVSLVMFFSIFLLGASAGANFIIHKTIKGASIAAGVLIDLTNENRIAYNESPLVRNDKLDQAANLKGKDMANLGYFAHISPTGVTPWHWFNEVGYNFLYAGENLAINFTDSNDVDQAWLNSPTHKANLLNVNFREIGIATVQGIYQNNPTIFVVQMFGTPSEAHAETIITESTTTKATTTVPEKLAVVTGDVKGESVGTSSPIISILDTNELAIAKNTTVAEGTHSNVVVQTYSTWKDRLLFWWPHYVDTIYKILILIVAITFTTMILIEQRKQHYKHMLYGIVLLLTLAILVFINRGFF